MVLKDGSKTNQTYTTWKMAWKPHKHGIWFGDLINMGLTDGWETRQTLVYNMVGKLHEHRCHRWLGNHTNMGFTDGWETTWIYVSQMVGKPNKYGVDRWLGNQSNGKPNIGWGTVQSWSLSTAGKPFKNHLTSHQDSEDWLKGETVVACNGQKAASFSSWWWCCYSSKAETGQQLNHRLISSGKFNNSILSNPSSKFQKFPRFWKPWKNSVHSTPPLTHSGRSTLCQTACRRSIAGRMFCFRGQSNSGDVTLS